LINHNQIYLLGNLTRDPELKYTNEGVAIAEMGIAVNKRWKDSSGTENRAADFFNITVWNNLAENCSNSLKKGDRVIVGGHLNLRTWENREGKKFNIVNITADIVAVSLEFEKLQDKEKKVKKSTNIERSKKGSVKGNSPDDEHVEVVEAIK
jgi:single-strand DNA-binding protein